MLGTQCSKEELDFFYEAYRKYGNDWEKVAAVVPNRSVEMVEALYMMNRFSGIFLSARGSCFCCRLNSNDDRSLLQSGPQPQTDGRRTPHSPASYSHKKVGSSPVSRLLNKGTGNIMSLPSWNEEKMDTKLESTSAKHLSDMDEDELKGRLGSQMYDKDELARERSFLMESEDSGTAVRKGRTIHLKRSVTDSVVNNHLDSIKKASGGTEKQNFGAKPGKIARHIARKNREKAQGTDFGAY